MTATAVATEPAALWFLDSLVRIKVSCEEGEGTLSVVEITSPRGSMPPLHVDGEDETFYVLDGSATFYVGDAVVRLGPGASLLAPKGVAHTYLAEAQGVRLLVVSAGNFERFVRAAGREERPSTRSAPPSREESDAITALALEHEIEMLGPPGMLPSDLER